LPGGNTFCLDPGEGLKTFGGKLGGQRQIRAHTTRRGFFYFISKMGHLLAASEESGSTRGGPCKKTTKRRGEKDLKTGKEGEKSQKENVRNFEKAEGWTLTKKKTTGPKKNGRERWEAAKRKRGTKRERDGCVDQYWERFYLEEKNGENRKKGTN